MVKFEVQTHWSLCPPERDKYDTPGAGFSALPRRSLVHRLTDCAPGHVTVAMWPQSGIIFTNWPSVLPAVSRPADLIADLSSRSPPAGLLGRRGFAGPPGPAKLPLRPGRYSIRMHLLIGVLVAKRPTQRGGSTKAALFVYSALAPPSPVARGRLVK